jgi:hypothetical protein
LTGFKPPQLNTAQTISDDDQATTGDYTATATTKHECECQETCMGAQHMSASIVKGDLLIFKARLFQQMWESQMPLPLLQ